jgi:hypothetical protein
MIKSLRSGVFFTLALVGACAGGAGSTPADPTTCSGSPGCGDGLTDAGGTSLSVDCGTTPTDGATTPTDGASPIEAGNLGCLIPDAGQCGFLSLHRLHQRREQLREGGAEGALFDLSGDGTGALIASTAPADTCRELPTADGRTNA